MEILPLRMRAPVRYPTAGQPVFLPRLGEGRGNALSYPAVAG